MKRTIEKFINVFMIVRRKEIQHRQVDNDNNRSNHRHQFEFPATVEGKWWKKNFVFHSSI